ncbi:IS21 family transposase [Bacillus hwajinpoensis]|uniref:IS21 family transposase n=1 Tax=Guptibacillus hwajinpoensis TaxID=208199 RepID=A0A845F4C0_9BACL|nr:IS21 family transposase [Pseudalkalibacillus hwajinpoensis]MYL65487.1 IS21 family transposase [Pseudalkalibacillus hwajinpoensis]
MVQTGEFFMIRELFQKGWSITAISDETGFDPKTIRKYIKSDEIPKRKNSQATSESKLDPYKEYLKTRIKEGTTNCSVLFDEIEALGYEGKMTILRDFVRPYRTSPKRQATVRYETSPGKQAQMDWGEIGKYEVNGEQKEVYAFTMVLSYSRMKYVEFTDSMNLETLMKCHMNAFAYFNGVPEQILYDNMKTAVIKHSPVEIRFNQKFEEFLAYYGIAPKACKPYRPQTKGKVENVVGYVKKNFLQRRHSKTLEGLNKEVRTWLDQTANRKVHQTTQAPPETRFQHEQKYLAKSNSKPLFPISHWEIRSVSKDCFISYQGNRYSVPYRYVGQELKIKQTLNHHLEIYDAYECIARHPIMKGKAKDHIQIEHYKGLKMTSEGLPTQSHLQSTKEIEVEQRSLQIYDQLESGDPS